MPPKYVKKTKKNYRRTRRSNYRKRKMLSFTKAPMPNKFATKLRYVSYSNIDGGAGVPGVHLVRANCLYDPDQTLVGHQPRGFDQIMTMYDHFVVIGSRITVDFVTNSGTAHSPFVVGIALKDSSATTDTNSYQEGRNVVTKVMRTTTATSGGQRLTLSKTFSARKFLGRSKPLSDPELKGSASSSPLEQAVFHIFYAPLSTTDLLPITVQYRIDYLAVFIEPKQPAQS